jgi:ArsR family transcriptional regulator, zinc-responsive transcriptional repressor
MISKDILETCNCQGFKEGEVYGAYKIFFGTLVSESRLKIINILRKKSMNVSELIEKLKLDQTQVSHDLERLRRCGFVKVIQKGKFRYYSLNEKTIKPLMDLIDNHMSKHCIHILRANKDEN